MSRFSVLQVKLVLTFKLGRTIVHLLKKNLIICKPQGLHQAPSTFNKTFTNRIFNSQSKGLCKNLKQKIKVCFNKFQDSKKNKSMVLPSLTEGRLLLQTVLLTYLSIKIWPLALKQTYFLRTPLLINQIL